MRFYHGFATAAFGPVAMATIAAFSGKNTGQNLSLYSSATIIGRALAPTIGGPVYEAGGYASVYLIAGFAGILALVFALWFFHKPGENEDKAAAKVKKDAEGISFFKKLWGLLTYRPLLFVGILEACTYFAYGAFEMIFPLYAKHLGMPTGQIGVLLGLQLVGIILFKTAFRPGLGCVWPSADDGRRSVDLQPVFLPAGLPAVDSGHHFFDFHVWTWLCLDHRQHQRTRFRCCPCRTAWRFAGNPEHADGCRADLRTAGYRCDQRYLQLRPPELDFWELSCSWQHWGAALPWQNSSGRRRKLAEKKQGL